MEWKRYVKYCLPDFVLCLLMTVGFCINLYQSFYLPEALSGDIPRLLLIAVPVTALLLAAAYSRRTVRIAVPVAAVLIIAAVIIAYAAGVPLTERDDPEANAGLWYLLTVFCPLLIFLLSRTTWGSLILLVGGMFAVSTMAVLEYECFIWAYLLFLFAAGVSFIYQRYRKNIFSASTVKDAFPPLLATASVVMAISLLAGSLLCVTVVRAIDPPVQDLHFITKIVSVEVLERLGISQRESLMDENNTSEDVNENFDQMSNQTGDQDEELEQEEQNQTSDGSQQDENSRQESDLTINPDESVSARPVTYNLPQMRALRILLIILAAALLAALIFFLANRRKFFLRRLSRLSREDQVLFFYGWYCKKFRYLKIIPAGSDTPYEYAARIEPKTRHLAAGDVTWEDLTDDFVRVFYGKQEISEEEFSKWLKFYGAFPKNCRKMLGGKYIFKYFVL